MFLLSLTISRMDSLLPIQTKLSFSYLVLPHDLLSFLRGVFQITLQSVPILIPSLLDGGLDALPCSY